MGASLSSDVYKFKVDEIFQDKAQCEGIVDDIVIFGYNDDDHDHTLYVVLDWAREVGMNLTLINISLSKIALGFMALLSAKMELNPIPERYKQLNNCQSLRQKLYYSPSWV